MDDVQAPHSRDNALRFFEDYTRKNKDQLRGKIVVDLSAGSGYIAHLFEDAGCAVKAFDRYPENCVKTVAACEKIELEEAFPISSQSSDIAILAETVEHLPDQLHVFTEVSRILRQGGVLLFTTPNSSSLRGRFSQFIGESEHYGTAPPNETDVFVTWKENQRYLGKLFISGVQRLRTLAAMSGLRIRKIHPTRRSSTSYWLLFTYPLIYYFAVTRRNRQQQKDPRNRSIHEEIFRVSTSLDVLLSSHLIIEFERSR